MRECSRCRRPAPDVATAALGAWDADGPDGSELICPGCMTRHESGAMDDDLTIALMEMDMDGRDGGPDGDDR